MPWQIAIFCPSLMQLLFFIPLSDECCKRARSVFDRDESLIIPLLCSSSDFY